MSSSSKKVYVIDMPGERRTPPADLNADRDRAWSSDRIAAPQTPVSAPARPWGRLATALFLGPIAAVLWLPTPRGRVRWLAISAVCLAIVVTLAGTGWPFLPGIVESSRGVLKWLIIAPTLGFALASVWARAFGLVMTNRKARLSAGMPWLRNPSVVGAAGLVVPGLGLLLTGHPRRGAFMFGLLAPLAAVALVLAHAPWLWAHRAAASNPGISGPVLEALFLLATGCAVLIALVWVIQALDGIRQAAPTPSPVASGLVSVSLLAAIVMFSVGFRPVTVAEQLDSVGARLQLNGWRVVPLVLSETASRLDPATPEYLARAAKLHAALGQDKAARARRVLLAERARAWTTAAESAKRSRGTEGLALPNEVDPLWADAETTWSRIAVLFR
jgi:hypothetical protein